MATHPISFRTTDPEEERLTAIRKFFPLVERATVARHMMMIGILAYWERTGAGEVIDADRLLEQIEQHEAKAAKKK